jgi:CRP-like cAMP-binding protein
MTQDTGTDFIQEFFGEGEIFGEIEMFNNDLSLCSNEAITPLTIFKIQKDDFHMLIDQDKTFSQLILKSLTAKIKYTAIRHSYNQSHTIEANLMRLKRSFPNLNETIPKRDLANYLGITERSLNRVLKAATVN